jgi:hypothetical protein
MLRQAKAASHRRIRVDDGSVTALPAPIAGLGAKICIGYGVWGGYHEKSSFVILGRFAFGGIARCRDL